MKRHLLEHGTLKTPQMEPILGRPEMVPNRAGGYVWQVDDWTRMQRFLILGTESGVYYAGDDSITKQGAEATMRCLEKDGARAVDMIVEVSDAGRAPSNDYALYALAMASASKNEATKSAAFKALPKVARIGTHLFHFCAYMEQFRGWGPSARKGISNWYNRMDPSRLAYQMVKYQQRDGWSHRDVIRLAHPKPANSQHDLLFKYATSELNAEELDKHLELSLLFHYEQAKTADKEKIRVLIEKAGLTREMLPSHLLKDPDIWRAMINAFPPMPMTALIRNLGVMTANGALVPGDFDTVAKVVEQLTNTEALHKARIHPISLLSALAVYRNGSGVRGKLTWSPVPDVVSALDKAFYLAFDNVEPTHKRICIGLDVSSSMMSYKLSGLPFLSCAEGATAMAMVTYRVEPKVVMMAFTETFSPLTISREDTLLTAMEEAYGHGFGGTNASLPMLWAAQQYGQNDAVVFDAFVIYTDQETWAGDVHPAQALQGYRKFVNPEAKLVVVGMKGDQFSIADPDDAGMLDVIGFDTRTPNVISDFIAGKI